MPIPERYQAEPLSSSDRAGWLEWSLDFFTDGSVLQLPYLDLTLQLDVTEAYASYRRQPVPGGSFFAFLTWHMVQAMDGHLSFKLRLLGEQWYVVHNAPVFIPVAVGGAERFFELVLEDVALVSYEEYAAQYREQLTQARLGQGQRVAPESFQLAHFFGNLPNLQFSGLTLHYRREKITGQTLFYFGKRYLLAGRMYIPLAVKMHHACTDPFVLDTLLQDFCRRFSA